MKTKNILLIAILTLASVSCAKENAASGDNSQTVDGITLTVTLPQEDVKTSLSGRSSEGNYQVLWKTGDKISINGTLSSALPSSYDGKKAAEFTVSGSLSTPYYVLYPGTTEARIVTMPSTQNYVAGTFDAAAAPMFGMASQDGSSWSAKLSNFCSVIRFTFTGSDKLTRIVLRARGGESITGSFRLISSAGGFTGGFSEEGSNTSELTYSFGSGLTLSGSTDCFITVPAQEYSQGFEALVYNEDNAYMRLLFGGDGLTLARTDLLELASKAYVAGRDEEVAVIGGLTAVSGGKPTAAAPGITVATYNLLRSETREQAWLKLSIPACYNALGTAIKNTAADLIGFNEIGEEYNNSSTYKVSVIAGAAGVSGYTWKLDYPSDIHREGTISYSYTTSYDYSVGYAYNNKVLRLEDDDYVWLAQGSEDYYTTRSSAYDKCGAPQRVCVWAKFTHIPSGTVFHAFFTQLPPKTQGDGAWSLNMAGGLIKYMKAKAGSAPHIFMGDMNTANTSSHGQYASYQKLAAYGTDAFEALKAAGKLNSFYNTYPGTCGGVVYKYGILQYCKNHPERRLDQIWTKNGITAQSYKTIRATYDVQIDGEDYTFAPSDHLPVVSYVTFE